MLMLAGLLVPLGCEQKPADRTPGKVTSEDVRRDARQAAKTAEEYSRQAADEIQKKLEAESAARMPDKATAEKLRRDAADAVKAAKEYSKNTKDEVLKDLEPQPARRPPNKVFQRSVPRRQRGCCSGFRERQAGQRGVPEEAGSPTRRIGRKDHRAPREGPQSEGLGQGQLGCRRWPNWT